MEYSCYCINEERRKAETALASLHEVSATRDALAAQCRAYKRALEAAGMLAPAAYENTVDLTDDAR